MCGDELTVWLKMDGDRIEDVSFMGSGCAISKASASIMTTSVKGKTREEAAALFERFHDLVTGKPEARPADVESGPARTSSGRRRSKSHDPIPTRDRRRRSG